MSTPARLIANITNAQASTGPRTEEGKAISSKNATKLGLFTRTDFIRPGEEDLYAQNKARLQASLAPVGPLEEILADEIHRAIWRLRRCGEVEGTFIGTQIGGQDCTKDPMQNEATAKLQHSVDRARSQAHRLLHKCTAELRRLQTDRQFLHATSEPGIADHRAIQKGLDKQVAARLRKRHLDEAEQFDEMCAVTNKRAEDLLTKQTQPSPPESIQIARNAPCPCKSGEKYKRCCGKNAPPLLYAV